MRTAHTESQPPVGVILAGGPGNRIGGNKASVALHGEPLLHHALRTMRETLSDVAIIAKPQTVLPQLEGVMVWVEPDEPAHPLLGVSEALALAGGRAVLVCPLDMPFISGRSLSALALAQSEGRPAVVASHRGRARPLVGCYRPEAAALLSAAAHGRLAMDEALAMLDPRLLEVEDDTELFDVDTPDDLLQAAAMLDLQRRSVRT